MSLEIKDVSRDAEAADHARYMRFYRSMQGDGVVLNGSYTLRCVRLSWWTPAGARAPAPVVQKLLEAQTS